MKLVPTRPGDSSLHVLLVEHEPDVLRRTAALLLADGHDLSTARSGEGLSERVERIRPDLILMDVLMPGLETRELGRIAARCRGGSEPVLVVHTKMLRAMLRRVLDARAIFAIIPRTEDDAEFSRAFRSVAERLQSEMPTQVFVPRQLGVASSGTYSVTSSEDAANQAHSLKHA